MLAIRSSLLAGIGMGLGLLQQQGDLGFFGLGKIFHFQLFHGALLRQVMVHPNTLRKPTLM